MNHSTTASDSDLVRDFFDALMRTDHASQTYLKGFQDNVLNDLLAFVVARIPFYRERLADVMTIDRKVDLARWSDIPILSQAELRTSIDQLRCYDLPSNHGAVSRYQSSGSTGRSLAFYRSALSVAAQSSATYRFYTSFGIDVSRDLAMIRAFDPALTRFHPKVADPQKMEWAAGWFANGQPGNTHRLTVFTPVDKQVEWLSGLGRVYLNTFPSNALAIARHVARAGIEPPSVAAVIAVGEPMTDEVRRQVLEYLRAPCLNLYSSAECGLIACECPGNPTLHLQSELALTEVLDAHGQPVGAGDWGRLIITPLYNFAMPLIRYDTGDLVKVAARCSCGRNHPAIDRTLGRPSNLLRKPDGAWFRPDFDSETMERLLAGSRWQLAQTGVREFELRYMPWKAREPVDADSATSYIASRLWKGCRIETLRTAALGPSAAGKFLSVVGPE